MDITYSDFNHVMEVILNDMETYTYLHPRGGRNGFSYSINGYSYDCHYNYCYSSLGHLSITISSHNDDDKKLLKLYFSNQFDQKFVDICLENIDFSKINSFTDLKPENTPFSKIIKFNNYNDISDILSNHNLIKPSRQKSARSVIRLK